MKTGEPHVTGSLASQAESHRILIVDDEPSSLKTMNGYVESFGYKCESVASGAQAFARIDAGIDLVLLDARMPGMDGFELIHRIRRREDLAYLPIIMVTEANADDFVVKPLDSVALRAGIGVLLQVEICARHSPAAGA